MTLKNFCGKVLKKNSVVKIKNQEKAVNLLRSLCLLMKLKNNSVNILLNHNSLNYIS